MSNPTEKMDFLVEYLTENPDADFKTVKAAAAEAGIEGVAPFNYGRAKHIAKGDAVDETTTTATKAEPKVAKAETATDEKAGKRGRPAMSDSEKLAAAIGRDAAREAAEAAGFTLDKSGGRGRPKLSDEEKAASKEARVAALAILVANGDEDAAAISAQETAMGYFAGETPTPAPKATKKADAPDRSKPVLKKPAKAATVVKKVVKVPKKVTVTQDDDLNLAGVERALAYLGDDAKQAVLMDLQAKRQDLEKKCEEIDALLSQIS
jgi:hypothetical protein